MSTVADKHEYTFQAEIKQLLHLLAHSLYQSKEIALRELVSNASDALDKMRVVSLTQEEYRTADGLEIVLDPKKDESILIIRDNGIGMTQDELVKNLGTIAHSGSLEFIKNLKGDQKQAVSLIGQFGVGFYSAFMIADSVKVRSRSYHEAQGWEWESDGTGKFTIVPCDGLERGTSIVLHLKEETKDLLEDWRIKSIIRKYSSFVPHPIKLAAGEVLNDQKPIWVEPKSQVTEEQYKSFYQHLTHRADEAPLWHLHLSIDSPIQFHSVIFCPKSNMELLGFGKHEHGMNLCAKRILVQNDSKDLLPSYLRFLYGLVDSEDLPLNVSRETLQDSSVLRKIKTTLTKQVLDKLTKLSADEPETYQTFYKQFGPIVKEGVSSDYANRERIAKLLRFQSTHATDPEKLTSLDEYVSRLAEGQTQIYFIGGPDLNSVKRNPHLEIYRKRGVEVLYLTDPIDEFVMSHLGTFEGKTLISVDSSEVQLPESKIVTPEDTNKPSTEDAAGFERVLQLFREALGDKVQEVRVSERLTDSPCCLVNPDGSLTTQMQRIMRLANKDFEISKRIFEVNPKSTLVQRLGKLSANNANDEFVRDSARQLYANSLLLEGVLVEPEAMVSRVQTLLEQAADSRPALILDKG